MTHEDKSCQIAMLDALTDEEYRRYWDETEYESEAVPLIWQMPLFTAGEPALVEG